MSVHPLLEGDGFVRLEQIVGDPEADPPVPAIIPISPRTWWRWVGDGRAPRGIKLGPKIRAWTKPSIRELVVRLNSEAA